MLHLLGYGGRAHGLVLGDLVRNARRHLRQRLAGMGATANLRVHLAEWHGLRVGISALIIVDALAAGRGEGHG